MAIPADYGDGLFTFLQSSDFSVNGVNTLYLTNKDRLFVIDVPASFSTGSAVVRHAHLTTSTSDVYYDINIGTGSSTTNGIEYGVVDSPLEEPKQVGFVRNINITSFSTFFGPTDIPSLYAATESLVVYSEETSIYRTYGNLMNEAVEHVGTAGLSRRDIETVRSYTGVSRYMAPNDTFVGAGTVADENKIYINNESANPVSNPTGLSISSWFSLTADPNIGADSLNETSNYTIKKRGCSSIAEYIVNEQLYAPEGLATYYVVPPSNFPVKVVEADQDAVLWVCSKNLNKISLVVSNDFTDSDGVLRVRGEVLIENTVGNKNKYSPVSIDGDIPYLSSDAIVFKPLDWICFYIGCTDGNVRYVCYNANIPAVSIVKDDRGCLWTAYEALP